MNIEDLKRCDFCEGTVSVIKVNTGNDSDDHIPKGCIACLECKIGPIPETLYDIVPGRLGWEFEYDEDKQRAIKEWKEALEFRVNEQ